ncbi:hypothetical protein GCM10009610_72690 [Pseudonocardia xinjiangensis]
MLSSATTGRPAATAAATSSDITVGAGGSRACGETGTGTCGIMDDMATQVLPDVETRPEGTDTTGNDEPKMFHYVKKNKIAESAVLGNMVVALCGETFPVTRSPKPGSPVCPDCKKIYEGLRPGSDA